MHKAEEGTDSLGCYLTFYECTTSATKRTSRNGSIRMSKTTTMLLPGEVLSRRCGRNHFLQKLGLLSRGTPQLL
eukprot:1912581-Pyramimonas_sp.AAC.1